MGGTCVLTGLAESRVEMGQDSTLLRQAPYWLSWTGSYFVEPVAERLFPLNARGSWLCVWFLEVDVWDTSISAVVTWRKTSSGSRVLRMRRKISSASASGRFSRESYSLRSWAFSCASSSFLRFKAFDRVVLASTSYTQSSYLLAHGWQVGLTPSHWYQLSTKPLGRVKATLTFMRSRLQHAHATWTTLRFGLVTFASASRWDAGAGSDLLPPRGVSLQEAPSVEAWLPSMFMS
jgi:hypothetical protein